MNQNQSTASFKDLNLHAALLKAIEDLGHTTPTPIQKEAIPEVLKGLDLRASAKTGTGKTLAYLMPSLQRLTVPSESRAIGPRILILVPTRELAMQVATEAAKYSKHLQKVKTVCIYGGAPYPIQNRELARPYEILVATPGRLIDHVEQGRINFSRLEVLILDEADRMLDMGFIKPVEHIASLTPKNRQTLLFSATLKGSVMNLSNRLLNQPIEISVESEEVSHQNIDQRLMYVDNVKHKNRLLDHLLNDETMNQAIVFTSTKRHADQLVEELQELGHNATSLHGDMRQGQRTRTLAKLRQGAIRILVATDVAARGIDVLTISHVINFDLPLCVEDYVHRIGRTGRAGGKGIAFSFAAGKDISLVHRIEKFTGAKMSPHVVEGLEPKMDFKSMQNQSRDFSDRNSPRGRFGGRSGGGSRFGGGGFADKPRDGFRYSEKSYRKDSSESDEKPRFSQKARVEERPRYEEKPRFTQKPNKEGFSEKARPQSYFATENKRERAPRQGGFKDRSESTFKENGFKDKGFRDRNDFKEKSRFADRPREEGSRFSEKPFTPNGRFGDKPRAKPARFSDKPTSKFGAGNRFSPRSPKSN